MCYAVPTAGALITSVIWWRSRTTDVWWLTLLFWGAALFGVIDHLWNGELFLISADWIKDLSLGVVISAALLAAWLAVRRFRPVEHGAGIRMSTRS